MSSPRSRRELGGCREPFAESKNQNARLFTSRCPETASPAAPTGSASHSQPAFESPPPLDPLAAMSVTPPPQVCHPSPLPPKEAALEGPSRDRVLARAAQLHPHLGRRQEHSP